MANIKLKEKLLPISDDAQALSHLATIIDIGTWQEVLETYHELKASYAPKRIFLVLDDESQASYTSMHASMREEFDNDADAILNEMELNDPRWGEISEGEVYPKQIAYYAKQLQNPEHRIAMGSFDDKMQYYNTDDFKAIIAFNENPLPVMDKSIVVMAGEFENEPLKLALLLNGYFTSDFDPFENFAIITMMDEYGFEFMGLGASLIGFIKTDHFDFATVPDLLEKLTSLYHLDNATSASLQSLIEDNNYVILPYSESPSELY